MRKVLKGRVVKVGALLFFAVLITLSLGKLYGSLTAGQWTLPVVGFAVLAALLAMACDLARRLEW